VALREVRLPKTLSNIGSRCFTGCTSLEKIITPTTPRYIGGAAFNECEKFSMSIPNTVDSIGNHAFYGCKSMTGEFDLTNVKYSGYYAFSGTGISKVLISPYSEEIDDFSECDRLKTIVFPTNGVLKTIRGFGGCGSLKSVTIPEGVTEINYAFNKCNSLVSVTIPNSVIKISDAFSDCEELSTVSIPSSITDIPSDVFSGTPYRELLKDNDGFYVLNKVLLGYDGVKTEIATPASVEIIAKECQWKNKKDLKKLVLSEGVKAIRYEALPYAEELTIPESVDTIEMYALGYVGTLYYNAVNAKFPKGTGSYDCVFKNRSFATDEVIFGEKFKTIPTGLLTPVLMCRKSHCRNR